MPSFNIKASLFLCLLSAASLLCACRHTPDSINTVRWIRHVDGFMPYEGVQETWPVAPHAFVEYAGRIPIYHGLPTHPYIVLGRYSLSLPPEKFHDRIAHDARYEHADAVLLDESANRLEAIETKTKGFGSLNATSTGYGANGESFYVSKRVEKGVYIKDYDLRFIRFFYGPYLPNSAQ